ncbi:unnamed protein product (macronuclear) [Paramecium tetraurelia]|uniref:Uncharacterized protein n=1 Tax=Paramecium tetraurelia TaxID=5888 RepID=A0CE91_PARTE|nr:uncharacterized protein GSPATT00037544001 [Paramecium tetraurelia]CAK69108.1 unnamed protein product [Paramecium tetraurelia]|eukprot:XP_001436505.1 hypothetical protein (macronuclear) [Paramecium tetraurelia strain d4-2]
MGTCQFIAEKQYKQHSISDIEASFQPYIVQLKLTPIVSNITGDDDRMDEIYYDIEKQISIKQEKEKVGINQLNISSKLYLTHNDSPSLQSDQFQEIMKQPRKNKNLNAKFKEMII